MPFKSRLEQFSDPFLTRYKISVLSAGSSQARYKSSERKAEHFVPAEKSYNFMAPAAMRCEFIL